MYKISKINKRNQRIRCKIYRKLKANKDEKEYCQLLATEKLIKESKVETRLTKEIVEQFVNDVNCLEVDFSEYKTIEDDAAECLSNFPGAIMLGVETLSDLAAESLSKHKGEKAIVSDTLFFHSLTELSEKAINSLTKHRGLEMDGYWDERSDQYAKMDLLRWQLRNPELVLTEEIALEYIEDDSINLSEYKAINEAAAVILGAVPHGVNLGGIESMTESVAKALANPKVHRPYDAELYCHNVYALSDHAIDCLCRFNGGLCLGITDISEEAAKSLSNHKGGSLWLGRLHQISDRVAEILADYDAYGSHGGLHLEALTEISEKAAKSFMKIDEKVSFKEPETIKKRIGLREIYLEGLTKISDGAAKSFSRIEQESKRIDQEESIKELETLKKKIEEKIKSSRA